MTREEAIAWFENSSFYNENHEPYKMAISALQAEPSDLISREEAMNTVWNEAKEYEKEFMVSEGSEDYSHDVGYLSGMHRAKLILKLMPSVSAETPTTKVDAPTNTPTDLISRADAIEAVRKKLQDWGSYAFEDYRRGLYEAQDIIEALPSADRPSGKWQQIEVIDDDEPSGINTDASECSVCGVIQQSHYWATHYYSYCPNCGAKMENK